MGRITQMYDYMNRKPEDFSKELVVGHYTHFTIDYNSKKIRRSERWYLDNDIRPTKV